MCPRRYLVSQFLWLNRIKGKWWMPRHQKTMKDVAACEKSRLGGKQPLYPGISEWGNPSKWKT